MTLVVQPHSGWIRKSAPGCRRGLPRCPPDGCPRGRGTRRPTRACACRAPSPRRPRATCQGRTGSPCPRLCLVDVADDIHRVRGGAAVVGQRLHLGGRVHVHHDHALRILRLPVRELLRVNRVRERAPGVEVGDQHRLLGAQDRGRLGHEVHAAEHDHLALRRRGLPGQPERVADVVGDVLDLGHLVVVRKDHRAALLRERAHLRLHPCDLLRREPADDPCVGAIGNVGAMGRFMATPPRSGKDLRQAPNESKRPSTPILLRSPPSP